MRSKSIVQIYEVQSESEAEKMIELGVDHIGTVLVDKKDWKSEKIRNTVRTVQAAGSKSSLIPLFSRPETVIDALDYYRPDIVHFCETLASGQTVLDTSVQLIQLQQTVKKNFPSISIMRSIPIAPPGQADRVPTLALARKFEPVSDYFLTDTFLTASAGVSTEKQPVTGFIGITGQICDWTMARCLVKNSGIPVILAGGIDPGNAADAIKTVQPAGLDSCTGTNARNRNGQPIRFKKDPVKVRQLVDIVRKLDKRFEFADRQAPEA